jgi:hypothetical protein
MFFVQLLERHVLEMSCSVSVRNVSCCHLSVFHSCHVTYFPASAQICGSILVMQLIRGRSVECDCVNRCDKLQVMGLEQVCAERNYSYSYVS